MVECILNIQQFDVNNVLLLSKTMKQIISLNVGKGGIRLASQCWYLFCLEHGIQPDGQARATPCSDHYNKFYSEKSTGKFIPRTLYVDLDLDQIDEIRTSTYRNLYTAEQLIGGKQDAGSIYARAYYTLGPQFMDSCMEKLRKIVQQCQELQGFIIYNSTGGGTGSGLGNLLLQRISNDFGKNTKLGFQIYPSQSFMTTPIVQPYNSVFATHRYIENLDSSIVLDNQAIYQICRRNLDLYIDICSPSYREMNILTAQLISSLTASLHHDGTLNCSLSQLARNLVPYPRLNSLLTSYSPIKSNERCCWEQKLTMSTMTQLAFQPTQTFVRCDPRTGKYIACNLMYRGDIIPKEVCTAICNIRNKKTVNFVDWCPGLKVGLNYQPPSYVPYASMERLFRSCCMISNSTSISKKFERINDKFNRMYNKKAFVHWYKAEGMEESQFIEARENMAKLQKDYEEVCKSEMS